MLGDPARASHTFDRFVADLAGTSGAEHGWGAANAEDWLFSRLRLYARGGGQEPVAQPRLHAVEPAVRQVEAPLPATVTVIAPRVPDNVPADVDDAPEIVNPRLRRPSAPLTTGRSPRRIGNDHAEGSGPEC